MNLSKVVKLFFLTTCIKNSIGKPLADSSYPTDYNALVPWPLIGEKFFIDLSGSKGEPFSTINVTLPSGSDQPAVTFKTINGLPNINSNDIYAGIIYKDAGGKTQYQKNYTGNEELKSQDQTFNLTGSGQEKITIFYRDSIHCLLKNKDKNTKVSCGDEKDKIVNVTYQLTKNALIPEEFIGNKFTISLLNSNGKKVLNTVIGKSPYDKPFINFDFNPIKNPMNIQVENNQKKKSLFSYLFKTDSHLSGKYKLIKVPLPRSITTSTTTTTETPTTSTATPYSTAPLTTAMASTLSTDTSTSAASPLYPAALAPLLATGMLLTQ